MHLPVGYQNVREYFRDAMRFLSDYKWVYRYPMTGLLVHNVLGQIPPEWQIFLEHMSPTELTMLSNGYVQAHWPASLVLFLNKCKCLQLVDKIHTDEWKLSRELCRGLSPKKQHEVSRMISLVHQECQKLGIHNILDVGSGLGYLDLALHVEFGYKVLGLERNNTYTITASQKASSLCANCEAVSFYPCEVSHTTFEEIVHVMEKRLSRGHYPCTSRIQEENISDRLSKFHEVCMIGLHTCGDLSAVAVDLFMHTPQLRLMVLVPCCYHKLATLEEKDRCGPNVVNFPLSEELTNVLKEEFDGFEEYLGASFLRLASQESCRRWQHWTEEQHQQHSENLMSRAVLDLAAVKLGLVLKKKRRRCVRKTQRNNFESFIEDAMERYDFLLPNGVIATTEKHEEILKEMRTLWLQFKKFCNLAEAVTGLQAAMQTSVESVILIDRITALQEKQSQLTLDVVKVTDEELSPRCRALIVRK
ncbi:hypothetical protein R5R35_009241 [Gryllus longicercus]|uniref:Methyltransferase domain-containing protein n=1 Tax=Gryllus longicercus TaxID=2509291 RepID=A0AAN9VSV1_9ORTH